MELSVSQDKLSNALSNVGRVSSSRTSLPILSNILLRTDGKTLVVAATNLEISTKHTLSVKIIKPGSVTVPAKLISEFVQNLPKGVVDIVQKNNQLTISSGGYTSTINITVDDDFPELPTVEEKEAVSYNITTHDLKNTITQTVVAASTDSTRPILTGVYWHSYDKYLYCAATDGYRLAEKKLIKTTSEIHAVVPVASLQEVVRTVKDEVDEVRVLFDQTQVSFIFDNVEITSRLIDGKFPDYRQLIPETSETSFGVAADEFSRVTKIANLFARESGGGITISADGDKNEASIHSIASEVGENTSTIETEIRGVSGSVSLNSRYLSDALAVIDAKSVQFGFSGKLAPCIVTSSSEKSDYKHIIMPLKS